MARPRVFVSSTYYDLRVLRADIGRFLRDLGYEPVLFEQGHVPYGKDNALEDYCYKELASCDIVINIIGGKFGTRSRGAESSVTQKELKKAIEAGKQVYIFIEKGVLSEFRTWQSNKTLKDFVPTAVNDLKIYSFIEEIFALPSGNPVEGFETSEDIVRFLKEQFAGLFQRLLQEKTREKESSVVESLAATVATLNHLVTFLTEQRSKGDSAIKDILLSTHPAFSAIKKAANIQYRVVFHNFKELDALLAARGYKYAEDPFISDHLWPNQQQNRGIRVSSELFDEEQNVRIIKPEEWKEDFVSSYQIEKKKGSKDDDDIPF